MVKKLYKHTLIISKIAGVVALALILLLLGYRYLLIMSATEPVTGGQPRSGGTLQIAIESRTDILDPHKSTGWVSFRVLNQLFEGLVAESLDTEGNITGEIIPVLARSWETSADGRVFTFYLREGIYFHDGTLFNADAVVYNIERLYKESAPHFDEDAAMITRYMWQNLEYVEALDSLTVQFQFAVPNYEFPTILSQLGMGSALMISPTALKLWGNKGIGNHPVGTGPFRIGEVAGNSITIMNNADYWGEKAYLERIVFLSLPDEQSRVNALQSGLVDMIFVPSPEKIEVLQKEGFVVSQALTSHVWFLMLNTKEPYLHDLRVRQAIAMAIDKKKIATELLKNTAIPANGLQAPGTASYNPDYTGIPYDPVRAKLLLRDAGYPDGLDLIMQTSVSGSGQILPVQIARWIQSDLKQVGINLFIETYEWINYIEIWAGGIQPGIGFNQLSWGMTADYWLHLIVNSESLYPNGYNTNFYANEEVDQLLALALDEANKAKRAALYARANEIVTEDVWHIPIVNDLAPILMSARVKGFVHALPEWYDFKTVWLENR